eukprot:GHVQ01015613.1.p1 GENE.GHVQ01015613.1~~GHVQ01015613.1.p1  ORF type:complete len:847 (+),score=107.31 GHVQ01015613.1:480-3020(+)
MASKSVFKNAFSFQYFIDCNIVKPTAFPVRLAGSLYNYGSVLRVSYASLSQHTNRHEWSRRHTGVEGKMPPTVTDVTPDNAASKEELRERTVDSRILSYLEDVSLSTVVPKPCGSSHVSSHMCKVFLGIQDSVRALYQLCPHLRSSSLDFRTSSLSSHPFVQQTLQAASSLRYRLHSDVLCQLIAFLGSLGGSRSLHLLESIVDSLRPHMSGLSCGMLDSILWMVAQHPLLSNTVSVSETLLVPYVALAPEIGYDHVCCLVHFLSEVSHSDDTIMLLLLLEELEDWYDHLEIASLINLMVRTAKTEIECSQVFYRFVSTILSQLSFVTFDHTKSLLLVLSLFKKSFDNLGIVPNPVFSDNSTTLIRCLRDRIEDTISTMTLVTAQPLILCLTELSASTPKLRNILISMCQRGDVKHSTTDIYVSTLYLLRRMGVDSGYPNLRLVDGLSNHTSRMTPRQLSTTIESCRRLLDRSKRRMLLPVFERLGEAVDRQVISGEQFVTDWKGSRRTHNRYGRRDADTLSLSDVVLAIEAFGELRLHRIAREPILALTKHFTGGEEIQAEAHLLHSVLQADVEKNMQVSTVGDGSCLAYQRTEERVNLLCKLNMRQLVVLLRACTATQLIGSIWLIADQIAKRFISNGGRISPKDLSDVFVCLSSCQVKHRDAVGLLLKSVYDESVSQLDATQASDLLWSMSGLNVPEWTEKLACPLMEFCMINYAELQDCPKQLCRLFESVLQFRVSQPHIASRTTFLLHTTPSPESGRNGFSCSYEPHNFCQNKVLTSSASQALTMVERRAESTPETSYRVSVDELSNGTDHTTPFSVGPPLPLDPSGTGSVLTDVQHGTWS